MKKQEIYYNADHNLISVLYKETGVFSEICLDIQDVIEPSQPVTNFFGPNSDYVKSQLISNGWEKVGNL